MTGLLHGVNCVLNTLVWPTGVVYPENVLIE